MSKHGLKMLIKFQSLQTTFIFSVMELFSCLYFIFHVIYHLENYSFPLLNEVLTFLRLVFSHMVEWNSGGKKCASPYWPLSFEVHPDSTFFFKQAQNICDLSAFNSMDFLKIWICFVNLYFFYNCIRKKVHLLFYTYTIYWLFPFLNWEGQRSLRI